MLTRGRRSAGSRVTAWIHGTFVQSGQVDPCPPWNRWRPRPETLGAEHGGGGRITDSGTELPEGGDVGPSSTVLQMFAFDEDGPGPGAGGLYLFSNSAGGVPSGYAARWGCPVEPVCTADWDHNGIVNSTDVSSFINDWFIDQAKGTLVTDWDGNGVSNSADVGQFINAWFEQTALGCG